MKLIVKNIGKLYGSDSRSEALRGEAMLTCPRIENAFLMAEDGYVAMTGPMADCPQPDAATEVIDAFGAVVTPAFCDSHTHIVWAGDRSAEFVDKINGLSYEEVARRGGGILNSADLLARTPVDELYAQSAARLKTMIEAGTGAVEIKTGYGLTTEAELKMHHVIDRLKTEIPHVLIR